MLTHRNAGRGRPVFVAIKFRHSRESGKLSPDCCSGSGDSRFRGNDGVG